MANLRNLKKEIDYRLEEFVFDCEMAIYFQPSKEYHKIQYCLQCPQALPSVL